MRVLFICKHNTTYGFETYSRRSCGLYNSTNFIAQALAAHGIHAKIVEVQDNNDIDREVALFKPDVVIIEAFWVVPEKFVQLQKLHPKVKWFCHLHSNILFLALEGIAMDWAQRYAMLGVKLIMNSTESYDAMNAIIDERDLFYLPNVYSHKQLTPIKHKRNTGYVDVGCFGAVRPLKNTLMQALAAIEFARQKGKKLRFHINATRIETGGSPVLKNLKQLFEHLPDCELVEGRWFEPEDFIKHLHHNIDIGMQVSTTETFNVVNADYVSAGIPSVISDKIKWASNLNVAEVEEIDSIVSRMHFVWDRRWLIRWNQYLLRKHSESAIEMWAEFCHNLKAAK